MLKECLESLLNRKLGGPSSMRLNPNWFPNYYHCMAIPIKKHIKILFYCSTTKFNLLNTKLYITTSWGHSSGKHSTAYTVTHKKKVINLKSVNKNYTWVITKNILNQINSFTDILPFLFDLFYYFVVLAVSSLEYITNIVSFEDVQKK